MKNLIIDFKILDHKRVPSLHMFSSPFDVNVEQAPEEFQIELIELQGNDDLKRDMKDYYSVYA